MNMIVVTDLSTAMDYQAAIILFMISTALLLMPPVFLYSKWRRMTQFNSYFRISWWDNFLRVTSGKERAILAAQVALTAFSMYVGFVFFKVAIYTMGSITG